MFEVKIIPVGDVEGSIMDYLAVTMPGNISGSFDVVNSVNINLVEAYDSARRQYNSTKILSKLLELNVSEDSKILAVTNVDLFVRDNQYKLCGFRDDGGIARDIFFL